MDQLRKKILFVTALAAGAAMGGLLFGYDTSTVNSAIPGARTTMGLSNALVGFIAAVSLIGCAVGAWLAGPLSTKVGRTRVMLATGVLMTAGSLGAAMGDHVAVLGISRFITGSGIGAASAVVPAYIAEIAPTRMRGRLGSLWQFALVVGQLLGLIVGYLITLQAGSESSPLWLGVAGWRWMFGIVAVLAVAYVVTAAVLPQSPVDLVHQQKDDKATAVLEKVGEEDVAKRMAALRETRSGERSLRDLKGDTLGLQGIVWAGLLLAMFQQLVGINVVKTYSNAVWQAVGISTQASFGYSILTVLISLASTIVAILLIDKVGRRILLLVGAAAMAVSLAVLAVAFSSGTGGGEEQLQLGRSAGVAAVVAMNAFAVAFGTSWGPVMWVMLSELFDSRLRTTAVAVCTATNWLTNWLVTRTFPFLADMGMGIAYGLYAGFAVLAFFFVLKRLPETRNRALS